jgi:hypothetical protein
MLPYAPPYTLVPGVPALPALSKALYCPVAKIGVVLATGTPYRSVVPQTSDVVLL